MGWNGNTMTVPISVDDIGRAVGSASRDVGTLCTSVGIHKWSKFKPFRNEAINFASDSARLAALRACNCGFTMARYNTPTACLNAAIDLAENGNGIAWTYLPPTGGIGVSPFRMLDFKDYTNLVGIPFHYGIMPMIATPDAPTPHFENLDRDITNINTEDLLGNPRLTDFYISIAWRKKSDRNNGTPAMALSIDTQSTDWVNALANTTYDVCAFFSRDRLTTYNIETTGEYYLCPVPYSTFEKSPLNNIYVDGNVDSLYIRLDGSVKMREGTRVLSELQIYTENPHTGPRKVLPPSGQSSITLTTTPISFTYNSGAEVFTQNTEFHAVAYANGQKITDFTFIPGFPIQD